MLLPEKITPSTFLVYRTTFLIRLSTCLQDFSESHYSIKVQQNGRWMQLIMNLKRTFQMKAVDSIRFTRPKSPILTLHFRNLAQEIFRHWTSRILESSCFNIMRLIIRPTSCRSVWPEIILSTSLKHLQSIIFLL